MLFCQRQVCWEHSEIKMTFRQALGLGRPLLLDGAMGTMLQASGMPAGATPEEFCMENPDTLRGIHAELAGDRRLLSDLVRDLQREVASQRGDSANLSTAVRDRIADLGKGEYAVDDGLQPSVDDELREFGERRQRHFEQIGRASCRERVSSPV